MRRDTLVRFAKQSEFGFPIFSDPTAQIAHLFGTYDDEDQTIQPGIVILDVQGVVRVVAQAPALRSTGVPALARRALRRI